MVWWRMGLARALRVSSGRSGWRRILFDLVVIKGQGEALRFVWWEVGCNHFQHLSWQCLSSSWIWTLLLYSYSGVLSYHSSSTLWSIRCFLHALHPHRPVPMTWSNVSPSWLLQRCSPSQFEYLLGHFFKSFLRGAILVH